MEHIECPICRSYNTHYSYNGVELGVEFWFCEKCFNYFKVFPEGETA